MEDERIEISLQSFHMPFGLCSRSGKILSPVNPQHVSFNRENFGQ